MSKNVIIVGSGLFGCVAAALCRSQGHTVTLIGDDRPYSASKASGCVLAPSWLSSLSKAQIDTGMSVLRDLYRIHDVEFRTHLGVKFRAQRVNPDEVLVRPDVNESVVKVGNGFVKLRGGATLKGAVLVAAGIWSGELVEMPFVRGLYGASVRFRAHLPSPQIYVYAPYRQAVGFQLDSKHVWFGDGTALILRTWTAEHAQRIAKTVERGQQMIGGDVGVATPVFPHKVTQGARPYVEGHKAGYFARPHPQTWVSTGGAKNGTLLAAAQAAQFMKEAKL